MGTRDEHKPRIPENKKETVTKTLSSTQTKDEKGKKEECCSGIRAA
jgi:hypothetical protein